MLLSKGQSRKSYYCEARLIEAVFGKLKSDPACRILLQLSFHGIDGGKFPRANIRVDIEEDEPSDNSLKIVHYAPEMRTGKPAESKMQLEHSIAASLGITIPGFQSPLTAALHVQLKQRKREVGRCRVADAEIRQRR